MANTEWFSDEEFKQFRASGGAGQSSESDSRGRDDSAAAGFGASGFDAPGSEASGSEVPASGVPADGPRVPPVLDSFERERAFESERAFETERSLTGFEQIPQSEFAAAPDAPADGGETESASQGESASTASPSEQIEDLGGMGGMGGMGALGSLGGSATILPLDGEADAAAPFPGAIADTENNAEFEKDGLRQPRADGGSQATIIVRDESREPRRPADTVMLVNDVPGDECRIALVRNGRLEAYFAERAATATNVGNIYKGRVINVEPAIQAAFIDFGEGQNGFLHVSDLHPRYFPGASRSEAVGRKIPRRDRPPMQDALKRGQEVLVQVIKEGLGTKGPTLTSYLSIPGRLLVMMPEMDNVGVSRKVDDEDQRREMRKILDSLDLEPGFGFILRTAGFDRSRNELQRDAAYLTRLWQAMERRMERTGAPCELYTESDLLVRTIRDVVDDSVHTIVVDSESAFDRAMLFLEIAFPKDPPKVLFYDKHAPIFHAFGIERQIASVHSREVPLPSGGALVFDQAEAMVAIDVNSGKSRSARDSETNAFNTNKEAVEEICRQLRLRDLGGLVVCDLIDMRFPRHRREIEDRFKESLRRDRAKTTVLPISEFGMVELTRQRMRPSLQKMHFMACPNCNGTGDVKIPESVSADALRDVQALLQHERIHRVEMVCSVKVASVLLSSKRERLYEIERQSGKRVDVRISEALPVDRVDLYGYDDRGADVEISRLSGAKPPRLDDLLAEPPDAPDEMPGAPAAAEADDDRPGRRRRRRRKPAPADAASIALAGGFDDLPQVRGDEPSAIEEVRAREAARKAAQDAARAEKSAAASASAQHSQQGAGQDQQRAESAEQGEDGGRRRRRRRGRRGRGGRGAGDDAGAQQAQAGPRSVGAPSAATAPPTLPAPPPPPPPPPEPRRVHLLAKEYGVSSKDLLAALRARETESLVLEAKNHMSMLPSEWVAIAQSIYAPPPPPPPPIEASAPPATAMVGGDDPDQGDDADQREDAEGDEPHEPGQPGQPGEGGQRKRRRRRRRGRGGKGRDPNAAAGHGGQQQHASPSHGGQHQGQRGGHDQRQQRAPGAQGAHGAHGDHGAQPGEGGRKKRRRRRRGGGGGNGAGNGHSGGGGSGRGNGSGGGQPSNAPAPAPAAPAPAPKPAPRGLYGRAIRKLGSSVSYDDR